MQRDTTDLTTENKELKLRLEALEQEAQLREGMHHFIFVYSLKNGHVLSPLSAISYWIGQINKVVQSLHLYVAWNIISWIFMCQFLPFPKLCMANWEANWLNIPPKEGLPPIAPKRVLCALRRCSSSFNASLRSAITYCSHVDWYSCSQICSVSLHHEILINLMFFSYFPYYACIQNWL